MDQVLLGLIAVLLLGATAGAATCSVKNWHRFRFVRGKPPFFGLPLVQAAAPLVFDLPRGWPQPQALPTRYAAALHRQLAEDKAAAWMIAGELILVVAGASVGLYLPAAFSPPFGRSFYAFTASVATAAFGVVARGYGGDKWRAIRELYAARTRELS